MNGIWHRKHRAMSLEQALPTVARMCATNANDMLKMRGGEDTQTGSIEKGKWADLIIADIKGEPGNYLLDIHDVFVRGHKV
ncbi:MAG: hypothetical protein DDT40_01468 [candidate division WS2 bacterium]|nr:hypothetical protein [Candidatus Psychracetigena formicireducens]